jgi:flagellar biosynthesis/type III secretory pathway protein FliH
MTKPDWAERLQRTFKRKYDLGYHEGYQIGYDEGFMTGSKKAVVEARKVFVKRIQEEIKSVSQPTVANKEYLDGLERAIEIIRKGK